MQNIMTLTFCSCFTRKLFSIYTRWLSFMDKKMFHAILISHLNNYITRLLTALRPFSSYLLSNSKQYISNECIYGLSSTQNTRVFWLLLLFGVVNFNQFPNGLLLSFCHFVLYFMGRFAKVLLMLFWQTTETAKKSTHFQIHGKKCESKQQQQRYAEKRKHCALMRFIASETKSIHRERKAD